MLLTAVEGRRPEADLKWNHIQLRRRWLMPKALTGCENWLDQIYKTEGYHPNIEKLTALIGYNAYIQETCAECVYETNKLKKHLKRCQH